MKPGAIGALIVDGAAAYKSLSPAERHRMAVSLLMVSAFTVAGMMTTLKLASTSMSLWQLMVLRSFLGALLCLPIFAYSKISILPSGQIGLYGLRIFLAAAAISCWIYSITELPLGVASAISFSKGFFALWLASLVLGEQITTVKVTCTLVGFVGVALVLDPTAGGSLFAGLVGVMGALAAALLTVVIKRLSVTEPTLRMMFYPLMGTSIIFAVPAALTWRPMDVDALGLVLAMVVLGSVTQWCFISAYRLGEVSALAPVEYARLVTAVLAGFIVFSEVPTLLAVIGMVMVCGASYAAFRFAGSS